MSSPLAARARLINELAGMNLPGHVPGLLPLVFGDDAVVARAAAAALERCLDAAPAAALPALDVECRRVAWSNPISAPWSRLDVGELRRLWTVGDAYGAVLAAASCHPSGWVREAAVERLDALGDPRALRWLLLRLNDWVEAVAVRARAAVEGRLDAAHAPVLLESFELVARMDGGTRRRAGDLLARVRTLLRDAVPLALLEGGLGAPDRAARRLALALLMERPDADRWRVLAIALQDRDVVVRLGALRLAIGTLDAATFAEVIGPLMRDPFPRVRRDALAHAVTHLGRAAHPWVRQALMDPSESVREVAQFGMRRLMPGEDVHAVYHEVIGHAGTSAAGLAIALEGLGAVGGEPDVQLLLRHVAHDRPRVRRAALRALHRIAPELARDPLRAALEDASPSVSRAARVLLHDGAAWVGAERLAALLDASRPEHVRGNALRLAARLPKWDAPPLLLSATFDPSVELAREARQLVASWRRKYNRTFVPPTPVQLGRLRAALARFGDVLEREELAELEAIRRSW